MKWYIARHGQVTENNLSVETHFLTIGNPSLTELGREQARFLGIRLRDLGFQGVIVNSPYVCTLETAEIIAKEVACPVVSYAPVSETLVDGMREVIPETTEQFQQRIRSGIEELAQLYANKQILIVSHAISINTMVEDIFHIPVPKYENRFCFNCSLSMIDTDKSQTNLYYDTDHLVYEKTTSNSLLREDFDRQFIAQPWPDDFQIPDGVNELSRPIILHFSDSCSWIYPYFRALIAKVKPDIIIHTGDMADEVKVGRIPGTRYEYLFKIKFMLDILENSGARVIITPGNNDLPDEIRKMCSTAEVYPNNTVLTINGSECRIGHAVTEMIFDKDWSFYGHGYTGESWIPQDNEQGRPHRFNGCWGAVVCNLMEDKYVQIPVAGNELWIAKSRWPVV